ncbi:hypothetical protein JCM12141A_08940 [Mycolicibacterium hodleri]
MSFDNLEGYCELPQAAARMEMTQEQVMALVRKRALRAVDIMGEVWVQPALISGIQTR